MARRQVLPRGLWRPSGTTNYFIDYVTPDGKRHRYTLKTPDLATATRLLESERDRLLRECHGLEDTTIAVSQLLSHYWEASRLRKSPERFLIDRRRIERFFEFVNVARATMLKPAHFDSYFAHRLEHDGVTRVTVDSDFRTINAFLNWSVRNGYLRENPAKRVDRIQPEFVRRRIVFLNESERDRLLDAARDSSPHRPPSRSRGWHKPVHEIIAVACLAGLRASEILHLDWEDIDFDGASPEIIVRSKDGFRTKTRRDRAVPLPMRLANILAPLRRDRGPCFETPTAKRFDTGAIRDEIEAAARRAGLRPRVNFLVLRHTYATILVGNGIPLSYVKEWLGHTSIKTTEKHYAEFMPHGPIVARAMEALSRVAPDAATTNTRAAVV